jgi:hypothetical protein
VDHVEVVAVDERVSRGGRPHKGWRTWLRTVAFAVVVIGLDDVRLKGRERGPRAPMSRDGSTCSDERDDGYDIERAGDKAELYFRENVFLPELDVCCPPKLLTAEA